MVEDAFTSSLGSRSGLPFWLFSSVYSSHNQFVPSVSLFEVSLARSLERCACFPACLSVTHQVLMLLLQPMTMMIGMKVCGHDIIDADNRW